MDFKNINEAQQAANNALLNSNERSQTVMGHDLNQSTFNKSFQQPFTCDAGKCIPVLKQYCYPGDTYKIKSRDTIKMSAPAGNPFNAIVYDVTYFFVPLLQIDENFKYRLGENDNSGILRPFTDELPKLKWNSSSTIQYTENDLAGYLRIPMYYSFTTGNMLDIPIYDFICYAQIWNAWYRDQNLQTVIDNISWKKDDGLNASDYKSTMSYRESIKFGKGIAPASKLPDRFTTSLPYQQKGSSLNLINFNNLIDNLGIRSMVVQSITGPANPYYGPRPLYLFNTLGGTWKPFPVGETLVSSGIGSAGNTSIYAGGAHTVKENLNASVSLVTEDVVGNVYSNEKIEPFNIQTMRTAIATQHYLERLALAGSRYVEQLKSIWKVEIDPLEVNRPEVIGGYTQTLINNNVQQTSESSSTSPLGKIATSLYNLVIGDEVEYTAQHYGIIMAILTIRTPLDYGSQGMPKEYLYQSVHDLFNPMYNGLGEQPVLNCEVSLSDSKEQNLSTFAYNEPWYETKTNLSSATGFLSLRSKTSLFSQYLYGQKFLKQPSFNEDFIEYKSDIIGTTLFKGSSGSTAEFFHQFLGMIDFTIFYTSSQPLYEVPGISRI